jgi:hypothetical protein
MLKTIFSPKKLAKIAENCDHNIGRRIVRGSNLTFDISLAHVLAVLLERDLHVVLGGQLDEGLAGRPTVAGRRQVDALRACTWVDVLGTKLFSHSRSLTNVSILQFLFKTALKSFLVNTFVCIGQQYFSETNNWDSDFYINFMRGKYSFNDSMTFFTVSLKQGDQTSLRKNRPK